MSEQTIVQILTIAGVVFLLLGIAISIYMWNKSNLGFQREYSSIQNIQVGDIQAAGCRGGIICTVLAFLSFGCAVIIHFAP